MARHKKPPIMCNPSLPASSQSAPEKNSDKSSSTTSTSTSSVAGLEMGNHVQASSSKVVTGQDISDKPTATAPAPPVHKPATHSSLGKKAASKESPLESDVSDTDDEVMATDALNDADAAIRPYLQGQFETYDQGDVAEYVSPDGDTEPKDLEVVETPEEDVQSATGEEVLEATPTPEVPDVAAEAVVLDEPIVPTPVLSPLKQANNKTNPGLTGIGTKHSFKKFTPAEVFEDYLQNPTEMCYEELYHKTSKVAGALLQYQTEYDDVDQQIIDHEIIVKAEAKRAIEDAKEESDRRQELDDYARDKLQIKYCEQLLFSAQDWQLFLKSLGKKNGTIETLKHLNNLRNPTFMEAARKRREKGAPKKAKKLLDGPIPDYKLTKEENDFEKRKLGRLLDPVKFDDMKMADVYGFEYSSHPSHYGNQPLDKISRQPKKPQRKAGESKVVHEDEVVSASTSRVRAQRTKRKRQYDADESEASDAEEEVPAKRTRRPRTFEDEAAVDPQDGPQAPEPVPAAKRTFPSGKRVGRPPKAYSQSKLQAVETARDSPDLAGEGPGVQVADNVEGIAPSGPAEAPAVKRKHPGGRPKKVVAPSDAPMETQKPKNKGGRPRKNPRGTTPTQNGTELVATVKGEPSSTTNMVQLGDADDVMPSTEVDEASRGVSTATSRLSSSEPSETPSSYDGAKRKTTARKTSPNSDDDDLAMDNPAVSGANKSKDKRKRATADTEPSPIIVEAPSQVDEPSAKRRRVKAPKSEPLDDPAPETVLKRKRKGAGDTGAKKAKRPYHEMIDDELDNEDEDSLSPQARKELAAKRAQAEKSKKLSISTKARWASGSMKQAQETRKLNQAVKKAEKEAAAAAAASATMGASSTLVPIQPAPPAPPAPPVAMPAPLAPKQPKEVKQKATPPVVSNGRAPSRAPSRPPSRPPSTRVRKPTRIAAGFDGAADDYDERDDFPSEYDRYQALTSAESPGLGKRVRRPLVDLSAMMGETSDEDYY